MEISQEQIEKAFKILSFVYPKYSENIQVWKKDEQIKSGFLYYVKKNNKITQIFFQFHESYLTPTRMNRLISKKDLLKELTFVMINKNKYWRIGWKI